MITKNIEKFNLFFSSILNRLEENIEFFIGIECLFFSGTKQFKLEIKFENAIFLYNYLGISKEITKDEIYNLITNELVKYEKAILYYHERTTTIVLNADEKGVKISYTDPVKSVVETATVGGRKYIIKENEAKELLKTIGIMAENGKIKNDMIRKYNQIDRFVELVTENIDLNNDNYQILDCACGKSYLSFVLNYYFTEALKKKCQVTGIDYNEGVIKSSKEMAQKLNYNNMDFIKADLTTYDYNKKIDMLVSLHACDIASDYAIFFGIKHKANSIICVPCCHSELSNQIKSKDLNAILKNGILARRFCDILTDSLRCLLLEVMGYKVSVIEYISPLDTPKNIMIKATKTKEYNRNAKEEYIKLKNQFNVNPTLEKLLVSYYEIGDINEL